MKNYVLLFSAILLLMPSATSHAVPILLNSGGHVLRSINYGDPTDLAVGYIFSLGTSQAVNAFGLYDAANAPSTGFQGEGLLSNKNEVNLWRVSDQVLLAVSASIPQSGADGVGLYLPKRVHADERLHWHS